MPVMNVEKKQVAETEWKGVRWKAAYGNLSVKEILTILKGFGPMETLEFEKPGCWRGLLCLSLAAEGVKEVTLYYLESIGEKRKGSGREAIQWLKKVFKGDLYVEDAGVINVTNVSDESLLFWIRMFKEGLVDNLEGDRFSLHASMSPDEIDAIEHLVGASGARTALSVEKQSG